MTKYVDLQIEYQRMWNKHVELVSFTIGTTGLVKKNLEKYLGRFPGQHNIYILQISVILGRAHILMKVLLIKPSYIVQTSLPYQILAVGCTHSETWVIA